MIKKNLVLIVGVAIPLLCIVLVVLAVAVPSFFVKPQYDFLYTNAHTDYAVAPAPYYVDPKTGVSEPVAPFADTYAVVDGKLSLVPVPDVPIVNGTTTAAAFAPQLYLYDVKTDSSQEISLSDAQALSLSAGPTSPDGYNIVPQSEDDGGILDIFGGGDSSGGYVITKGNAGKKLTAIRSGGDFYEQQFELVGWVAQ